MPRQHRQQAAATAALCALSLGGCVQMTRHSNTLVFGTNTSFGIVVGTDATSTPSISIGYKRQEAVVMPLVANVRSVTAGNANLLEPCLIGPAIADLPGAAPQTHPCLLVGRDGPGKLDAYSVLASFGTKYDAQADGVGGSIAQYFATGVAAQHLALSGGAAVATGGAALASAEPANVALREAVRERRASGGVGDLTQTRRQSVDALADAVAAQDSATLPASLAGIDTRLTTRIAASCPDAQPATCAATIRRQAGGLRGVSADRIMAEAATLKGQ